MYVSDSISTVRSLKRYILSILTFKREEKPMASASSPVGAPPALTHKPTPTPTKTAPTIQAINGYLYISGKMGVVSSRSLYEIEKTGVAIADKIKNFLPSIFNPNR